MQKQRPTPTQIKELLSIGKKIKQNKAVSKTEADRIIKFQFADNKSKAQKFLTNIALPCSIVLGMTIAAFPQFYINIVAGLPAWTNMGPNLLNAVDYVWSIIGKPVKQPNIIYHIPNVILYSFGVIGVKKLFEYLRKKTWLDIVEEAKNISIKKTEQGELNYSLNSGHSLLFIGDGDFIGQQFYMNTKPDDAILLSAKKQFYSTHWLKFDPTLSFTSLQQTLNFADAYNCGEYVLFPIIDTEIFLPGPGKYDLSPEKTEVIIQAIRDIERLNAWAPKRIIIVGDKNQTSSIRTETQSGIVSGSVDQISLATIKKRFEKIIIIDPTDLVIETLLKKFPDRRILFRSSIDGGAEYKIRFYERLQEFGYVENPENDYSLVVGYDLYEEQIERESIATNLQEYVPIVLSREVYDALIRNGYAKDEFLYVPEIVLNDLARLAAEN